MSDAILDTRRRALEDAFFIDHDRRLARHAAEEEARRAERDAIGHATGITDPDVIDQLIALDLCSTTLAALAVVPMVAVAWADGDVAERERDAVLDVAEELGLAPDSPSHDLLEAWLLQRPPATLLSAWEAYTSVFTAKLDPPARDTLRNEVISRARAVAEAQGGFLRFGRISAAEDAILRRLEAVLT